MGERRTEAHSSGAISNGVKCNRRRENMARFIVLLAKKARYKKRRRDAYLLKRFGSDDQLFERGNGVRFSAVRGILKSLESCEKLKHFLSMSYLLGC